MQSIGETVFGGSEYASRNRSYYDYVYDLSRAYVYREALNINRTIIHWQVHLDVDSARGSSSKSQTKKGNEFFKPT